MKNINIEFGGFYCSIHEQLIDSMLDSYYADEHGNILYYYDLEIDYLAIFDKYAKKYLLFLKEYLYENYNLQFKPVLKGLNSPREYNFDTDKINIDLNEKDYKALVHHFKQDNAFKKWLIGATQSCSGYHSFYTYDDAINDKENVLLIYAFQWLCTSLIDDWLQYYDFNNLYEMLHHLDMPQLEVA
jgi:hypothetical protein